MVTKVSSKAIEAQTKKIDERLISELRDADIYKVLAKIDVPKSEIQKFFAGRYVQLKSQVIQDELPFAEYASMYEPNIVKFNSTDLESNAFRQGESQHFMEMMISNMPGKSKVKAATIKADTVEGEEALEAVEGGELTPESLEDLTSDTLGDVDDFFSEVWSTMLDAQLVKDLEAKRAENERWLQRILALVKSGKIGAEFALIALAKVSVSKYGSMFTWLTKKQLGMSEEMSRVSEELFEISPNDAQYSAHLFQAQSETRGIGTQMNIVQSDLQKLMSQVQQVMDFVSNMTASFNQFRREVISKIAAR